MDIPAEIAGHLDRLAAYKPSVHIDDDGDFGQMLPREHLAAALGQVEEFARLLAERNDGRVEYRVRAEYYDDQGDERGVLIEEATAEQLHAARALILHRLAALNAEAADLAAQYIGIGYHLDHTATTR